MDPRLPPFLGIERHFSSISCLLLGGNCEFTERSFSFWPPRLLRLCALKGGVVRLEPWFWRLSLISGKSMLLSARNKQQGKREEGEKGKQMEEKLEQSLLPILMLPPFCRRENELAGDFIPNSGP